MSAEAVIALISVTLTVALTVTGGVIKICAKLEKLNLMICSMVTKEECNINRKKCRWYRHKKP